MIHVKIKVLRTTARVILTRSRGIRLGLVAHDLLKNAVDSPTSNPPTASSRRKHEHNLPRSPRTFALLLLPSQYGGADDILPRRRGSRAGVSVSVGRYPREYPLGGRAASESVWLGIIEGGGEVPGIGRGELGA